jgi:hypothetical protein
VTLQGLLGAARARAQLLQRRKVEIPGRILVDGMRQKKIRNEERAQHGCADRSAV